MERFAPYNAHGDAVDTLWGNHVVTSATCHRRASRYSIGGEQFMGKNDRVTWALEQPCIGLLCICDSEGGEQDKGHPN